MTPAAARDASHAALLAAERDGRIVVGDLAARMSAEGERLLAARRDVGAAVALAHRFEGELGRHLHLVRTAARRAGRRTLEGEFTAQGLPLFPAAPALPGEREDAARSTADAKAFAGAWLGVLLAKAEPPKASDADAPGMIVAPPARTPRRAAEVTAASSAADAFADERERQGVAYARHAEAHGLVVPIKQWSAMLDACPRCRRLHGQVRPLGVDFSRGLVPGLVHRSCRCVMTVVVLAGATVLDEDEAA